MAYLKIKKEDLQLVKPIGVGGFGAVFQAKWKDKDVAAKRLNVPDQHEVEFLSKIDHPNIVKLIGVCEESFDYYLVLELCSGGSLRSYLNQQRSQKKKLPIKLVYDWGKQAAKPIQYLEQMKIVHKDIKSPNYLIAEGNVLKLADFGLAKKVEFTTKNATDRPSTPWMAPELLTDGVLSPTYDIYAYGVVVWELCTTYIPFEGSDRHHIIWRVCNNGERLEIPSDCPKHLADLMKQCWEKDWHKRPTIDHILMVLTSAEMELDMKQNPSPGSYAELTSAEMELDLKQNPKSGSNAEVEQNPIAGSWVLEKTVFGQLSAAVGITLSSTEQIAVADWDEATVQVFSDAGQPELSIDTTQGLIPGTTSDPYNIAISSVGDYHVTDDTRFVKVYDPSGVFKTKWATVSPDNVPSDGEDAKLRGLAVDSQGQFLVGECLTKYISIHGQDGSHVNSFPVNIEPDFIAVTSQNTIVVCDPFCNRAAQIVDITGQVLHVLKPEFLTTRWKPYGVCCYKDTILICNWTRNNPGVYCFSTSGEYLRCLDTNKAKDPRCPALSNGKLYVSYADRVEIYKSM